jgi:hypothetical protein
VRELAAMRRPLRASELIYCWDPDGPADPRGLPARPDHCDHIHGGWKDDPPDCGRHVRASRAREGTGTVGVRRGAARADSTFTSSSDSRKGPRSSCRAWRAAKRVG